MDNEENVELQEPENTEQADSQVNETPDKSEVDWERRYKDLQADHTKTKQRVAELSRTYSQPKEEEPEDYADEPFVDRKTVKTMINKAVKEAVSTVRTQTADSYFRRTYPELTKHENAISGILGNPSDPDALAGATAEERIDAAVKEFNAIMDEKVKAAAEAKEAEIKAKEEKNRKASGLSGPSTTPTKGDEQGEMSDEEEIKAKKARRRKKFMP